MVRAFRAEETVDCGDAQYTLAIDIATIDAIEDDFDLPFNELMGLFKSSVRIGRMARLLRGLLSKHHPSLTLDDIGALVMGHSEALNAGLEKLFLKASPDKAEAAADENPPKPRRGTGANSSSRGAQRASRRQSSGSKRLEHSS